MHNGEHLGGKYAYPPHPETTGSNAQLKRPRMAADVDDGATSCSQCDYWKKRAEHFEGLYNAQLTMKTVIAEKSKEVSDALQATADFHSSLQKYLGKQPKSQLPPNPQLISQPQTPPVSQMYPPPPQIMPSTMAGPMNHPMQAPMNHAMCGAYYPPASYGSPLLHASAGYQSDNQIMLQNQRMFADEDVWKLLANPFAATNRSMGVDITGQVGITVKCLGTDPNPGVRKKLNEIWAAPIDFKQFKEQAFKENSRIFYAGTTDRVLDTISWAFEPSGDDIALKIHMTSRIKTSLFIKMRDAWRRPMCRWYKQSASVGKIPDECFLKFFKFGHILNEDGEDTSDVVFKISGDPLKLAFPAILAVFVRYFLTAPKRLGADGHVDLETTKLDIEQIHHQIEQEMPPLRSKP